jgi:poly-gamma-glutamate capsule biosynthesis protein CapA/YwtB (metallophosphatase superfamily)
MNEKLNKLARFRKALSQIDRRSVLGKGAAAVGGLLASQLLKPGKADAQTPAKTGKPLTENNFTLTVVGEALVARPFAGNTEPEFTDLVKLLRESDVSYAHLETNIAATHELEWAARGSSGAAGYLVADPQIAKDMAAIGIDIMSLAQNHSYDWGVAGLRATIKHCEANGIAHAGTGEDLEEATEPGYLETDKGRIALISVASGNSAFEWAGYGKGPIRGRPGVNPLRLKKLFEVDKDTAAQLKAAGGKMGTLSARAAQEKEFNITPGAIAGSNGFSGSAILEGDKFAITTASHPGDEKRNLRSVDEAKKMADFVMVAHHNSVSEEGRGKDPADFVVDFARKAIDAGADIYIGHGWHTFLGIEIYKSKPIIYGLGSFFWQSAFIQWKAPDQYESHDFDMDELVTYNASSGNLHPGGGEDWAWAAAYQFVFNNKKLTEIRLTPLEMGMDYTSGKGVAYREVGSGDHKYLDGSPRIAMGSNGRAILGRLQALNQLRGTKMDIVGNVGIIKVA